MRKNTDVVVLGKTLFVFILFFICCWCSRFEVVYYVGVVLVVVKLDESFNVL